MKFRNVCAAACLAISLSAGCGEDASTSPSPTSEPAADGGSGDVASSDAATAVTGCETGAVELVFVVDDTANKTYTDGELIWTGSFSWEESENTLTYATSWLPEEGPFPPLHDDGPLSEGGHEPEGSVAGDHIWGVSVCYVPEQTRTLSYGLLNGDLRWIWEGPNGTIEVSDDAEGPITVPGMAIGAHGDRDFRVTLALDELHADYLGSITVEDYGIFLKGTMNSWTPIQLLDDGANGDESAGDGVLTYEHSRYLGPHDGLLRPGQEAQFVFVFAMGESSPDDGIEYKVEGDAALEGVAASGECDEGWEPLEVVQSLDSKGVVLNASIVLCDAGEPVGCQSADDCADGEVCVDGDCQSTSVPGDEPEIWLLVPDLGDVQGGDSVSIQGKGFQEGLQVTLGGLAAAVVSVNEGEIVIETPAHPAGEVDVVVTNPDGTAASYPGGFSYAEDVSSSAVKVTEVTPATWSPMGGTMVALQGVGLDEECALALNGESFTETGFQAGAITFAAPMRVPGEVEVSLECAAGSTSFMVPYAHTFDGALGDWPAQTQLATNSVESDWGEENFLQHLYAGSDGETLYVGVAGHSVGLFGPNAIVVYVDVDYGSGTGLQNTADLSDEDGGPDAALGGVLAFSDPGFGAELGFVSLDLADYWPGEGDPASAAAGWRAFEDPTDLTWLLEGPVIGDTAGLEASIPLSALYGEASAEERTLAIGVRLVSGDGDYHSNQALPGLSGSEPEATNAEVSTLTLTY